MKTGFGVEEEYLLTHLDTRQVVIEPTTGALSACREALGLHFSQEMFKSQIEVASSVFSDLPSAHDFLSSARQRVTSSLAAHGLGICAAGSHPWGGWQAQLSAQDEHYQAVFDDYQQVARQSLLCGLHIHVGVPPHFDRIRLINQLLPWLPLLLMLSTSSPFWEGQPTGYRSYRRVLCNEWPRMGLPERLLDWPDYQRYLTLLHRTGVRPDVDCWWAIRPSRRYPTVELRIADGCPRLEDGLCIAALFYGMVTHCIEVGREINLLTRETHWVTQENLWRAMRYGCDGRFIDSSSLAPLSAREWLLQLQARFELADVHIDQAIRIFTTGSSADQQLKIYDQAVTRGFAHEFALRKVVDLLINQTAQPAL